MDGTLIDSKPVILDCFARAAQAVFPGRAFDAAAVRLGPPLRAMFQLTFPEAAPSELESLVRVFRSHYDHEGPTQTRAYEGAIETLAHCQSRGIALDIATNKPWRISTAILTHLKMDGFFRFIVGSDTVQPPFAGKGEMVRHLLQAGPLQPGQTWYLGDSPEDAAAAAQCRLPFVWAAYGYGRLGPAEIKSVYKTIHSLSALPKLLA